MHEINFIDRAIALVRRGDFVSAANDPKWMNELESIRGGDHPAKNLNWLTSRTLLAEVNDQTGQYENVADIYPNWNTVNAVRKNLSKAKDDVLTGRLVVPLSDQERRLFRAMAFYIMQAGILRLRRFELDGSLRMLSECDEVMGSLSSEKSQFHGVRSLLHYWQGRIEMARNRMPEALEHFNESMRQTEKNLTFHYSGTLSDIRPGDERIAYASYSLSSCMAFGVAHINHVSGHLTQALHLLRPASAMLMGTGDNYRRGYAQMLVGAAERALAGRTAEGLERAIDTLNAAFELFGGTGTQKLAHRLHQARVSHQLALAHTYLSQIREKGPAAKDACLTAARFRCEFASGVLSDFEDIGFGDPELRYDLSITWSRVFREQGDYEQARRAAGTALHLAETHPYAPSFSQAKARVARAEAYLAQFENQPSNSELLDQAEVDLRQALKKCDSNLAIRAVTHLYLAKILGKRGKLDQARQQFHEGWHRRENLIQNGWVRQLAAQVELETMLPDSQFTLNLDDVEREIASSSDKDCKQERLWDVAVHRLKKFMVEWAQKRTPHEPWVRLGLGRAAYFDNKHKDEDSISEQPEAGIRLRKTS